jgi:serine/threonine protein kinase
VTTPAALADGRYRLERTLGGGGMATVRLGRDVQLDRAVAVKMLAPELAEEADVRARFVREARLAARLSHPNIVAVFDTGEEDGLPFIVMEHVPGETLAARLRARGRLSASETAELGVQACAGLEHAHEAGLVHRDVKPANLLLRPDGTVKIADFGIARAAEASRVTAAGTVLGTAAYLAPEQARGGDVTPATDVYALSAVLYECLTGRPPFAFESLAELGRKQAEEAIVPVRELAPETPPELEEAIMHALARLPERRPASAAAFAAELTAESPLAVTQVIQREPRRYAARRRRRLVAAVVGAVAAVAAAVAIVLSVGGDDPGAGEQKLPAPPERGSTPEETARNLAEWLRANARDS